MRTRLLGGVAALIVAIIGAVLLITYVNSADQRAYADTETQEVYVVQKPIAAGTAAASLSDSVAKKPMPKGMVPADAVADLSSLSGKVTSVNLEVGEQLIAGRFADPATLHAPGRVDVPAGMQEVTVRLPIERVVGGALSAGDLVGVALSFPKDDNTPAQTRLSYNKVLVTGLQVSSGAAAPNNATAPAQNGGGGVGSASQNASNGEYLVTLARPAADAVRIVYAAEFGKVYLTKQSSASQNGDGGILDRTKVFQ
ncbi:pilus assembly protein CpaB [Sinomonas sp. RB5]